MLDAPLRTIAWCQLQAQTDRGEDARKNLSLSKSVCVLHIRGVVLCIAVVFDQNSPVSGSFELIYRVLKKTKMFESIFTNVTVAGSAAAALGQRANVHTAVLSKCTHILAILVK